MEKPWAYDVFLSYSAQDKEVVHALERQLHHDGVHVWLDIKAIQPGTPIPAAINRGLDEARVYVLAMSPQAFASPWVEAELSAVQMRDPTNAQERCLLVMIEACEPPTLLRSFSYIDYRDRSAAAYTQILKACRGTVPHTSAEPDHRVALSIALSVEHGQLVRSYYNSQRVLLDDYQSPWHDPLDPGQLRRQAVDPNWLPRHLFELLFGPPEARRAQAVIAMLRAQPQVAPSYEAIRVRIHTTEPSLAALPWALTQWQEQRLTTQQWTFEMTATAPTDYNPRPRVEVEAPFPVALLAAPESAASLSWEAHRRDVEQQFRDVWRVTHQMLHIPTTRAELAAAQQQGGPPLGLLYYYGPGVLQGDTLCLALPGIPRRPVPVETMVHAWGPGRVQAVFLNLLQPEALALGTTLAACSRQVPLLMAQTARPEEAPRLQLTFLDWLHAVLDGREPLHALHDHGHRSAVAWGHYDTWHLDRRGRDGIPMQQLAHFLLDRTQERALVNHAVDELIDRNKRLTCMLAYADPGNRVDIFFPEQARDYLRSHARDKVSVELFDIPFPSGDTPRESAFEQAVRQVFTIRDPRLDMGLARALEQVRAQKFAGKLRG